jgi:dynein heavy chain
VPYTPLLASFASSRPSPQSVLVVAGAMKRGEPADTPEQAVLLRALRDFNTPKIVKADEVVFFGLLRDLFPSVDPPRKVDAALEAAATAACVAKKLTPDPAFVLKVTQLEDLLAIRHCVFLMGPAGSGKSTLWATLAAARGSLGRKTKAVDLDPKVVSPEELYGCIHPATREWRDGVLSKVMRELGAEPDTSVDKWIGAFWGGRGRAVGGD